MSERAQALAAELTETLRAALEATGIQVEDARLEEDPEAGVQAAELAHARIPAESDDPLPGIDLIAANEDALKLSLLRLGIDKEELEERVSQGFDDTSLESLRAFVGDVWGGLRGRFEEILARPLTSGGISIAAPSTAPPELEAGDVRLVVGTKLEGVLDATLEFRVGRVAFEMVPIVLVDSGVEDLAQLVSELGKNAIPVAPSELNLGAARGWCGSPGVVLSWNLGDTLAPDWISTLRENPATQSLRLVVSLPRPTRTRVLAALRAGADSVLASPYSGAELATALGLEVEDANASEAPADSE